MRNRYTFLFIIFGDNILGSVCPSVNAKSNNPNDQSKVCVCNQWVCADNHADVVGRLLIIKSRSIAAARL